MAWRLPQFRFSLRTLLFAVLVCAVGSWLYTNRPERLRAFRNQQARQRIEPYELSIAGDGNPRNVPAELVAVLGDSRLKHWNRVVGVEILSGDQLATWGNDRQIRLWDTNTGRQLHQQLGVGLAASGDRKQAFFVGTDSTIRCWNVAQSRVVKVLPLSPIVPPIEIQSVGMAANTDGSILVTESRSAGGAREIIVWDVPATSPLYSFVPGQTGGGALAVTSDGKFFTWEHDGQIQVSETETGNVVRTFGPLRTGDERYMLGEVKLSADESKLYVGSARNSVTVFDFQTGEELEQIGHARGGVHTFALNENEKSIVFGGQQDFTVQHRFGDHWIFWEGDTSHTRHFGPVDWHGNLIAAGSEHALSLWASIPTSGLHRWRLRGGAATAIRALAFHPDGKRLFTGNTAGEITAWEVGAWRPITTWQAHERTVATLAVSRDGSRLLSSSDDQTVAVWNAASYREISLLRDIHFYATAGISPSGEQVAAHVRDKIGGDQLELSESQTGHAIRLIGPITHHLTSAPVWSPNGQRLALTDTSRSLKIFDALDWKFQLSIGKITRNVEPLSIAWFSDNQRLLTAGWGGDEIHVLDAGQTAPLLTIHAGGHLRAAALHPSEQWIAACGEKTPVQLWHLPTSRLRNSWQIGPAGGVVSHVAFSPDGHYLATLNGNGTVYILSLDGLLKL